MKAIIMLSIMAISLNAQVTTMLISDGNYRGTDITSTLGDTNTVFSNTTTVGDWIYTENDSVYNGSDSTLIGYHEDGYIGLPLASVDGQDYRVTMQMKEGEEDLLDGWDFTSGWTPNGGASVTDADTYVSDGVNGVVKNSVLTDGVIYQMRIAGTTTASYMKALNYEGTVPYSDNLSGTFDETFTFTADETGLFLANFSAGTTDITLMTLHPIDSESQSVYSRPIFTVGSKSLTQTAVTDSWQNYTFDFTATGADTFKVSSADITKFKIDNVVLTR